MILMIMTKIMLLPLKILVGARVIVTIIKIFLSIL